MRQRRHDRSPTRLDLYIALLAAVGLFILATEAPSGVRLFRHASSASIALWGLVVATVAGEFAVTYVRWRDRTYSYTMASPFALALLGTWGLPAAILSVAVASVAEDAFSRSTPRKAAFNVGQATLALWSAGVVYDGLSSGSVTSLRQLPAFCAAALVNSLISDGLVRLAVHLDGRRPRTSHSLQHLWMLGLTVLFNVILTAWLLIAMPNRLYVLVALVLVILPTHLGFRSGARRLAARALEQAAAARRQFVHSDRTVALALRPNSHGRVVKRVAILAMESSPDQSQSDDPAGGIHVYVRMVAREFVRVGVEVYVFTRAIRRSQPPIQQLETGVWLFHVSVGRRIRLSKRKLLPQVGSFAEEVAFCCRKYGLPTVISGQWWLSSLAALKLRGRLGVPVEARFHSTARQRNQTMIAAQELWPPDRVQGEARVVGEADLLIVGSLSEHDDLVQGYAAAPDRIRIVPCGVDQETFHWEDPRRARDRLRGWLDLDLTARYLLVCVGRLDPIKGFDLAIDAFARLVEERPDLDAELLIVGGPRNRRRHANAVRELRDRVPAGVRVHFVPSCQHEELPPVYQAADIVLVPSFYETFGLVALEAQACGTPVVAARVGALPEVVRDGLSGVLVPGRAPGMWAREIANLLDNPTRLDAMGEAAVKNAGRFPWSATVVNLLAAYQEALARKIAR